MPRIDTPRAAYAWIARYGDAIAAYQAAKPARIRRIQYDAEAVSILELFWNAPLGRYRPCGCPCDVAVFGHTRCALAGA